MLWFIDGKKYSLLQLLIIYGIINAQYYVGGRKLRPLAAAAAERGKMKAVITVTGKDKVGIIAMASDECSKHGVNIIDISQTVMKEYFAMIMLVELDGMTVEFSAFAESIRNRGLSSGVDIRVMHEDIFNSMHKI